MTPPTPSDSRTITQRRHDALEDLALDALGNPERNNIVHGERAHVTFIVEEKTGTTTTASGWVLPAWLRQAVIGDASWTSVWMRNGVPFEVGTPQSAIPITNRRAVLARDRCCRFKGCGRAPRWSEIHHMKHRENGGTHELPNIVLLCRFHHRLVHRHNLKLSFDTDQLTLIIEWPNGVILHSPPPHQTFQAAS